MHETDDRRALYTELDALYPVEAGYTLTVDEGSAARPIRPFMETKPTTAEERHDARLKAACEAACDVLEQGRYGTEASYLLACVIAEKALAAADAIESTLDAR